MTHPIGPNVIIQTARTLTDRLGAADAACILAAATPFSLSGLPPEMVDERSANALIRHLTEARGPQFMRSIMEVACEARGDPACHFLLSGGG